MSDIPVWVDWFQALADKIVEIGEVGLIERVKRVDWSGNQPKPSLLIYGDKNIDPFSFLYFLAQTFDENRKETVKENVSQAFDISNQDIFSGSAPSKSFPSLKAPGWPLFHDGKEFNPDVLWKLFRQVHKRQEIKSKDFADALDIRQVGPGKLTQCFFYIKPKDFFPITKATMPVIQEKIYKCKDYSLEKLKNKIKKRDQGLGCYKYQLCKFKSDFPDCPFYEIYEECINGK